MWKDGLCSVQLEDHGLLSYLSHFFFTLSDFPSRKIFPYYTRDILCNRLQIFTFYMSGSKCLASCTQTPSMACIIKPVFFQNFGMQVFPLLLPNFASEHDPKRLRNSWATWLQNLLFIMRPFRPCKKRIYHQSTLQVFQCSENHFWGMASSLRQKEENVDVLLS